MTKEDLRERYEATGDERLFEQARPLYEQELQRSPGDAGLLREFGYLLECHGRYAIRAAARHYRHHADNLRLSEFRRQDRARAACRKSAGG